MTQVDTWWQLTCHLSTCWSTSYNKTHKYVHTHTHSQRLTSMSTAGLHSASYIKIVSHMVYSGHKTGTKTATTARTDNGCSSDTELQWSNMLSAELTLASDELSDSSPTVGDWHARKCWGRCTGWRWLGQPFLPGCHRGLGCHTWQPEPLPHKFWFSSGNDICWCSVPLPRLPR